MRPTKTFFALITCLVPRLTFHPSIWSFCELLAMGQVPDRGDTKLGDVVPGERGCRKAPGRKEVREKGCCWRRYRCPKYPHLHIQGCCLVLSAWNIKQGTGKKPQSKRPDCPRPWIPGFKHQRWRPLPSPHVPSVHLTRPSSIPPLPETHLKHAQRNYLLSSLSLQFAFLDSLLES